MRRTLTALSLILLAATALGGCSKPKGEEGIVVLRMTVWDKQEDLDFYKQAFETEFYKTHPNIRVEVESVPWIRMFDKLLISTAGGRAPDVSHVSSNYFTPSAAKNLLEDLGPYIESDPDFDISDFYGPAVEGWGKYKGKIYAIPGDVDISAMYYNKTMFDKHRIPYPDESWDWKKFLEVARKLTKDFNGDGKLDQWGCVPDSTWHTYVWQNGGDVLNTDNTRCILDQPAAYEGLQWMCDLRNKHHVAPTAADAADIGSQKMFTNGQIGMYVSGSWAAGIVFPKEITTFEYDCAPLPRGKQRASFVGGACWGILRGSRHKKEAWELVKFMSSPSMQKHFAEKKQVIPSRRSVAESGAYLYLDAPPKNKQAFIDAIEYGRPLPKVECSPEMNFIIYSEIAPALLGKATAEEVCRIAAKRANDLLLYEAR
ncbi:MAG: sugar ABC transporter substrate-binding protein [Armatimonadetes bacterium]|nr:sugar ABC transporter substrate-binding protein [Armatimonadota bacterium]